MVRSTRVSDMNIVYLYVIDGDSRKASSCMYTDPRRVHDFYECIRAAASNSADCVLTEVKDGFRIEVYL